MSTAGDDQTLPQALPVRSKLQPGRAPATVNRHLSAMRACWNWARSAGLIPQDRLWPSRLMLTEPKGRTRYLTDDELAACIEPDMIMSVSAEKDDILEKAGKGCERTWHHE